MMNSQKMAAIAEKLLELSRKGKVSWTDTVDENRFIVSFPEYSVSISETFQVANTTPLPFGVTSEKHNVKSYVLTIHNQLGTEIEYFQINESSSNSPPPPPHPTGVQQAVNYTDIKELYEFAKRKALNADKVLDDLLAHLSSEG